jgi:hypothetical protein
VPTRAIAEAIGRHLKIPVASIPRRTPSRTSAFSAPSSAWTAPRPAP